MVHPEYHAPKQYYDIALMELENHVLFSKYIQPACLWTQFDISNLGSEAIITGWGVVEARKFFFLYFVLEKSNTPPSVSQRHRGRLTCFNDLWGNVRRATHARPGPKGEPRLRDSRGIHDTQERDRFASWTRLLIWRDCGSEPAA